MLFKNLKNKIKCMTASDFQKNLLYESRTGWLVWAQMPVPQETLEKIEDTHRIRPYLIMAKDKEDIYGYQCSSSKYMELNSYEQCFIDKKIYNKEKDTWINLTTIYKVPIYNLKNRFYILESNERYEIQKRLQIQKNKKQNVEYDLGIQFKPAVGDVIVINGKLNYIWDTDNTSIDCYPLVENMTYLIKKYKPIEINSKRYFVDFSTSSKYAKSGDVKIVDIALDYEIKKIQSKIEKYYSQEEKYTRKGNRKKTFVVGSMFKVKRDNVVYLYAKKQVHYGINLRTKKVIIFPKKFNTYSKSTMSKAKILRLLEEVIKNSIHRVEIEKFYEKLKNKI